MHFYYYWFCIISFIHQKLNKFLFATPRYLFLAIYKQLNELFDYYMPLFDPKLPYVIVRYPQFFNQRVI